MLTTGRIDAKVSPAMADFDDHNQRAIDRLNQRGGRMLSLVDLVDAGTLALETAALLALCAERGAGFLTCAGPGGVGKTTLLGGYLAFLAPETEIVTVDSPRVLERPAPSHPECLLVHEINNAPYYGYLWGPPVGRFMAMQGGLRSAAATVHADTYSELQRKLLEGPLRITAEAFSHMDLIGFIAITRHGRRVTSLRVSSGSTHEEILRYDERQDAFLVTAEEQAYRLVAGRTGLSQKKVREGVSRFEKILSRAQSQDVKRMELVRGMARRA